MPKSDVLVRIASAARANSGRSKLLRWMRANRKAFAAMLEEERPSWAALAEAFAAEGMTGPDGKALKPESVRHTWYRTRKIIDQSAKKKGAPLVTPISVPPPTPPEENDPLAEIRRLAAQRSGREKS